MPFTTYPLIFVRDEGKGSQIDVPCIGIDCDVWYTRGCLTVQDLGHCVQFDYGGVRFHHGGGGCDDWFCHEFLAFNNLLWNVLFVYSWGRFYYPLLHEVVRPPMLGLLRHRSYMMCRLTVTETGVFLRKLGGILTRIWTLFLL